MNIDKMKVRIIADNDQDLEACRQWFKETSNADKMRVWAAIQAMPDDGIMGVVSRFAQLKFAEIMAESESSQ